MPLLVTAVALFVTIAQAQAPPPPAPADVALQGERDYQVTMDEFAQVVDDIAAWVRR